jgi:hypothetical protein
MKKQQRLSPPWRAFSFGCRFTYPSTQVLGYSHSSVARTCGPQILFVQSPTAGAYNSHYLSAFAFPYLRNLCNLWSLNRSSR